MIVRTDPAGERHHNLSWLMIPMDLPGITVEPMDLLLVGGERGAASGVKNTVTFVDVRVPVFNLVGGENNGWEVAGSAGAWRLSTACCGARSGPTRCSNT